MRGNKKVGVVSREALTGKQLEDNLRYYSSSGEFLWRNAKDIYTPAGSRTPNGVYITLLGTRYKAEDLAWLYTYGVWPSGRLIHKDGDVYNNAIDNLEEE